MLVPVFFLAAPIPAQAPADSSAASLAERFADPATWAGDLSDSALVDLPVDPRRAMETLSGQPYPDWQKALGTTSGARVHLELGHRLRLAERPEAAFVHYELAARLDRELGEAHLALATLAGQLGRYRQSARAFAWLAELDPDDPRAFAGRALALERLGRHVLAVSVLEEALAKWPERHDLPNSLARLLAASPKDTVRDGARAVELAQQALQAGRQAVYAQTLAMAMAEVGRFADAANLLRTLIERARASGDTSGLVRQLEAELALYESGRPYRLGKGSTP